MGRSVHERRSRWLYPAALSALFVVSMLGLQLATNNSGVLGEVPVTLMLPGLYLAAAVGLDLGGGHPGVVNIGLGLVAFIANWAVWFSAFAVVGAGIRQSQAYWHR